MKDIMDTSQIVDAKASGQFTMDFSVTNLSDSNLTTFPMEKIAEVEVKLGGTPYFIAEICLAIISVIANTMILSAFVVNRKLRTISHLYIASLAVSDFGMGALGIPIILLAIVGLPKNYILCVAVLTFFLLLDFCSIFSLLALTFDRYYAICWPFHYNAHMTGKRAAVILAAAWVVPLMLALIMPLGWNYGDPNAGECIFLDLVSLDYLTFIFLFGITTPFLLMCAMYVAMFRVIQRQIKEIARIHSLGQYQTNSNTNSQDTASNSNTSEVRAKYNRVKRERKTALLFGLLLVFFAFTWGPIFLMDTLLYFGVYIDQFWINFGVALSHFNSAFNPVIYSFKREFKHTYRRWFCRCCKKNSGRVGPDGMDGTTNYETDYTL